MNAAAQAAPAPTLAQIVDSEARIFGGITYARRHPGTQLVTVTLEIESTASADDLHQAVASILSGQEHHYQCDMDDDGGEVDVELRIVSAETELCRADSGVTA